MTLRRLPTRERRDNLNELDPMLRNRLLALDEPVARNDWAAVVRRSRGLRLSSRRTRAQGVLAVGLALLCAIGATLGLTLTRGASSSPAVAPVRLAVQLTDGSGLVLYSRPQRDRFVDNSDGRRRGRASVAFDPTAAAASPGIERTLTTTGPFHLDKALLRAASSSAAHGPMPGDRALLALNLYTTSALERRAGSAVLTCQYGFDRDAYCEAAFDLDDGSRLMAAGALDAGATNLTLVATGSQIHAGEQEAIARGARLDTT